MDAPTLTLGLLAVIAVAVVAGVAVVVSAAAVLAVSLRRCGPDTVRREPAAAQDRDRAAGAGADEPTRYVFLHGGEPPRGPVDLEELRAMHLDGRLGDEALAAVAGGQRWWPLADLLERAGAEGQDRQATTRLR